MKTMRLVRVCKGFSAGLVSVIACGGFAQTSTSSNLPPLVSMVTPTNGSVFYTPVTLFLIARASDPDGTVTNVEFFAGTTDLGQGRPAGFDPPGVNGGVALAASRAP